jgi:hypothetical protein
VWQKLQHLPSTVKEGKSLCKQLTSCYIKSKVRHFLKEVRMKRATTILMSGLVILAVACAAMAVNGGMPDSEMPTPAGGCSDAIGCHTTSSSNGVLALTATADDDEWNTPGEPGTLRVAVNIDSANSDADMAGLMLLDPEAGGNITGKGWIINTDPNQNDTAYNYNLMLSVAGDMEYSWSVNSPDSLGTYLLIARMHFDDGGARYSMSDTVEVSFLIGSEDQGGFIHPETLARVTSHPNPFSESTTISYHQGTAGRAAIKVYDLGGRLVRTLADGTLREGPHAVVWDGRDDLGENTPVGLYLYRLETPYLVRIGKTVLLR